MYLSISTYHYLYLYLLCTYLRNYIYVYISTHLHFCISTCLHTFRSIYISDLFVYIPRIYQPIYLYIYTPLHPHICTIHSCILRIFVRCTYILLYIYNLYLNLYIIQYTHVSGTAHFNWLPGASWYRVVADVCGAALASCTAHFYWDARWKEREERQFGKSPFKLYGWQLKYADYTWLVYIYTVDAFLCWFSHSWWWIRCSYEQMDTDMSKYMN